MKKNEGSNIEGPGNVEFPDFETLSAVLLDMGIDKDCIDEDIILHEKEHFEAALRHGITGRIFLRFLKNKDGRISFLPSVIFDIPDNEEQKEILRSILNAPSEKSPSDEEHLK